MFIDLGALSIIGIIIEGAGVYAYDGIMGGTLTTFCFSVLIMIIALTRWGYKGLLIAPILALSTTITGRYLISHKEYHIMYDGLEYLSILASLASVSIILLWYKLVGIKKTLASIELTAIMCIITLAVVIGVQTLFYYFFVDGVSISIYLIIYNGLGIAMTFIGVFLLRQQQILINVKQKLIDDRKKRDFEIEYEKKFSEELFSNKTALETKDDEKNEI